MHRITIPWTALLAAAYCFVGGAAAADTWFGSPISTPIPSDAAYMEMGLLNPDGNLDLVLSRYDLTGFDIFFGDGLGHFSHQAFRSGFSGRFDFGDIDGDGDIDAAFSAGPQLRVYTNDGSGMYATAPVVYSAFNAYGVEVDDLDCDGYEDVVVASGYSQVAIYWSSATGLQTPPVVYPIAFEACPDAEVYLAEIGEFTGDTTLDILVSAEAGSADCGMFVRGLKLFTGLGSRQFSVPPTSEWIGYDELFDPDREYGDLGTGDIDGDLDRDVVAADGVGFLTRLSNDGGGNFAQFGAELGSPGGEWSALGDFDQNGYADLAWTFKNRTSVHSGNANMTFPQVQFLSQGTGFVVPADVDGVSGLDLVGIGVGPAINVLPNVIAGSSSVESFGSNRSLLQVLPSVTRGPCEVRLFRNGSRSSPTIADVSIHDPMGRVVRLLMLSGDGRATWDLSDGAGRLVPGGVYWLRTIQESDAAGTRLVVVR